mgnify:CR=1 FL=1
MRGQVATELAEIEAEIEIAAENAPEIAPTAGGAQAAAVGGAALLGKAVVVRGLSGRPEYNGRRGRVLQFDESRQRYAVRLAAVGGAQGAEEQARRRCHECPSSQQPTRPPAALAAHPLAQS